MKKVFILCLLILLYAFSHKSENNSSYSNNFKNQYNEFDFIYKDKSKVKIKFKNGKIRIFNGKKININIPYSSPNDVVLPFSALIVNNNLISKKYYLFNENILLLPVSEVNNRFNLLIINLDTGFLYKTKNEDNLLSTSCPWFFLFEKDGIIVTMNNPKVEGFTLIHYFKISKNNLKYLKSKNIILNSTLINDEVKLKLFLVKNTLLSDKSK